MIHKDDTLAGHGVTNIICGEVEVSATINPGSSYIRLNLGSGGADENRGSYPKL